MVWGARAAADNARAAGFDGVELHGTSGYLPMQFLCSGTNHRSDDYGGSTPNRARFMVACLAAMADAIGSARVGLRLNPATPTTTRRTTTPRHRTPS